MPGSYRFAELDQSRGVTFSSAISGVLAFVAEGPWRGPSMWNNLGLSKQFGPSKQSDYFPLVNHFAANLLDFAASEPLSPHGSQRIPHREQVPTL